jgi:hypothetical protein
MYPNNTNLTRMFEGIWEEYVNDEPDTRLLSIPYSPMSRFPVTFAMHEKNCSDLLYLLFPAITPSAGGMVIDGILR